MLCEECFSLYLLQKVTLLQCYEFYDERQKSQLTTRVITPKFTLFIKKTTVEQQNNKTEGKEIHATSLC